MDVVAASFAASRHADVPLTIAALPGDARMEDAAADALANSGGLLLDVVYGHWTTALSEAWERAGSPAQSGLGMLLHQAAPGFSRWFGTMPTVTPALRDLVVADIEGRSRSEAKRTG